MNTAIAQCQRDFWNGIGSFIQHTRQQTAVYSGRISSIAYHCLALNAFLLKFGIQSPHRYSAQPSVDLISKIAALALSCEWMNRHAAYAEPTFMHSFEGAGEDKSYDVITTVDDGIVIAGYTNSFGAGGYDEFVAKWWFNGTLAWAKTLGGARDDWGLAIASNAAGEIILGGATNTVSSGDDVALTKLWTNGTFSWSKIFGGPSDEQVNQLAITETGEIVVAGITLSEGGGDWDVLVSLWETDGTLTWTKTLGGAGSDFANAVKLTPDGGFVIAGSTNSSGAGDFDVLIAKWWMNSTYAWGTTIGGSDRESVFGLTLTGDDGIIAVGWSNSVGAGSYDAILVKWGSNGTPAWFKTLGETGAEGLNGITNLANGGFIATGFTSSYRPSGNVLVTEWSADATLVWAKVSESFNSDSGFAITTTTDGSIVVTGETIGYIDNNTNVLLAKFTSNGEIASCTSRKAVTPSVYTIAATLSMGTTTTDRNWTNPIVQNWVGVSVHDISQNPRIICPLPKMTGSPSENSPEGNSRSADASSSPYNAAPLVSGLALGFLGIVGLTIAGVFGWSKYRSRNANRLANQPDHELGAVQGGRGSAQSHHPTSTQALPPPYEPPSYPAQSQSAPQYQSTVMDSIPNLGSPSARPAPYQIMSHGDYQSSNHPIPVGVNQSELKYSHTHAQSIPHLGSPSQRPGSYAIVSPADSSNYPITEDMYHQRRQVDSHQSHNQGAYHIMPKTDSDGTIQFR